METIGLGPQPEDNDLDNGISEKNNYCKVCWHEKGEYRCLGGTICRNCLNKLPYEMRGDIADILIYDAIRAAKKYDIQPGDPASVSGGQIKARPQTAAVGGAPVVGVTSKVKPGMTPSAPANSSFSGTLPQEPIKNRRTQSFTQPKKHVIIYGVVVGVLAAAESALMIFMNLGSSDNSLNAEDIVGQLQTSGFAIIDTETYDENTDPEGLLGQDGAYTSKTVFTDSSSSQSLGCSIEVFANSEDASMRKENLEMSASSSFFAPTIYNYENVVMVLDQGLSGNVISEYEQALVAILSGQDYVFEDSGDADSYYNDYDYYNNDYDSNVNDDYDYDGNVNNDDTTNDTTDNNSGNQSPLNDLSPQF
ncbi:MAG: hypothetical protein Q4C00_01790 [Bacillota bacterium]|nr:hypothetical protein [Bacillota bacterium]